MRVPDDCVNYLKSDKGFTRLMEGLYDLYVRYERCFGAVRLARPTEEEEKAISDFFKRDYYNQALIRIGLADFERQVQKVFSPEIRMEPLLESYFGRSIVQRVNTPPGPKAVSAFSIYVEFEMYSRYEGTEAETWLHEVTAHVRRGYRLWADRYNTEPESVAALMTTVCEALLVLPAPQGQTQRLTDFAAEHQMDVYGEIGPLFLRALAHKYETPYPSSPEEISALYYKAGLLYEGVLSAVTVRGLHAFCDESQDEVVLAYNKRNEPHILTLENLDAYTRVEAHNKRAYIIENLPVFAAVNERVRDCDGTLICGGGGINAALLYLLDMLSASGTTLYYSGDMDYAGLCLADRLYLRYPKRFEAWRFNKSDYERVMSENDFFIPDYKKETGLHNEDLAALLSLMRKKGKTAAQSALVDDLARDIRGD